MVLSICSPNLDYERSSMTYDEVKAFIGRRMYEGVM